MGVFRGAADNNCVTGRCVDGRNRTLPVHIWSFPTDLVSTGNAEGF